MQFQVPQFLDVEDKIIGPFTMKQFLYLAGGVGLAYLSYKFIPIVGVILGFGMAALGAALAFYKFNNKPFIFVIESGFNYMASNRLYVWRRKNKEVMETQLDLSHFTPTKQMGTLPVSSTSTSKLSDLTWSMDMDTKGIEAQKVRSDSLAI